MALLSISNNNKFYIILISVVVFTIFIWKERQFLFYKNKIKSSKKQHITLNANLNDWKQPPFINSLSAPWNKHLKDNTKFDYKIVNGTFYFYFKVIDSTLTLTPFINEKSITKNDRVELFFSSDNKLSYYYCIEINPKGFVLDYQAQTYRKFQKDWDCKTLETTSLITKKGFIIEGSLSIEELNMLGIEKKMCYLGVFRADFLNDKKIDWYSWVIPNSKKPDFHIPSAFKKITIR